MAPHATPQRVVGLLDRAANTVTHEPATRAPDAPAFPFAPGAAVSGGRYELIQLIGKGGMGWVFEAHDRERQQRVALKSLREPGPSREFRLKREFRALADLRHPNLVRMLELGREGDTSFITMELVDGVDFSSHVRPGPGAAPDIARLRAALPQLVSAVQALHAAGTLHGDLKPSNVLVDRGGRVVVLDFGLLHETASHLYAPEAGGAGTPGFMAPEQLHVRAIAASDWYSVGAMIYHALTCELPPNQDGIASAPADAPCADLTALQGLPPDLMSLALDLLQQSAADRPDGEAIAARVGSRTRAVPATRVIAVDGLVGRAAELQRLRECIAQTQAGRPSRALIAGASGIGKTALVTAFLAEVVAQGAVVLSGKCHERDTVPYKALDTIVDELSRYLRKLPQDALAPLLPHELPALLQVFPVLGRLPLLASAARAEAQGLDPAHTRKRALHGLKELLRRIGEQRTLVLFIDDLQWGDIDSARLLMHLMAPPDPPRMMLLAAYRSGEVGGGPAVDWLLAGSALPGDRSHTLQLAIEALSPGDSRELVGRLLQAPSSIRDALASESAGNPLFATELALAWLGRAHDPATDGGIAPPAFSLSWLLGKRIAGLPAASAELLELTVVAARPPRVDVLQHALPGGSAALWAAIDVLKAERFVTGQTSEACERIAPCHDRVREAIDAALDPARRTARHRQLADAVEAVTPDEHDVLLEHLLGAGRTEPAGECAARAGDAASRVLAFERAALFFENARDLLPAARVAELGIDRKLASVLAAAGRCNEAATVYLELARRAQDRGERAELLRHGAVQALAGGSRETGIAAFQELFALLGLRWPSSARAGTLVQVTQLLRCALLVAVALRRKEPRVRAESADQIAALFAASESLVRYEPRAAGRMTMNFVALALRGAGPALRAHACTILGNVWLVSFGPGERVFRLLERARELAAQADDAHALAASRTSLSLAHQVVGRFAQGEALAEQAVRLTRNVPLARITHANAQQLRISAHLWQGKLQAADRELTILLVNARETGHALIRQQQRMAAQAALHAQPDWQAMQAEPLLRHVGSLITPGRRWRWESWFDLLGALYRGDVARAAQLETILHKDQIWGRMANVQQLFARGLIALAGPVPELDAARRALALNMARTLERLKLTHGSAYAALLRAGVAAFDRQEAAVRMLLADAASGFFACGMLLYAHCAQRALGRMDGGAAGAALIADAEAFMRGQTVVDFERWTRCHVPGYDAVLALRAPAS